MSQSSNPPKKNNLVRARVTIRGTRPLLQHAFGPDAIPLESAEKTGVPGNDPGEWRKTMMVMPDGQLYLTPENVFASLRDGAKYTKKGRGSIQPYLAATLQVEESFVLLNRRLPDAGDPPRDRTAPVYIDVCGVKNPSTKARNIRYRLAASPGWECTFTLLWDRTVVSREQMKAVLRDAGILVGICDGRSVGKGRYMILKFEELGNAEEAATEGGVGSFAPDRLDARREEMLAVPEAVEADGVSR